MARTVVEKDYYAILALSPEAGEEEIRKAYRRLAFSCHPDRNPGDPAATERFKDLSEAYAVLIDPAKRRQYDLARRAGTPGDFTYTQQDLFRDLFTDPRASAIFDELAREFERMGMRVDRHFFQQTLFGGRTVVTGGVFVISPLTPVFTAFRLLRAVVRGVNAAGSISDTGGKSLPGASGLLSTIGRFGRWLLGSPVQAEHQDVTVPLNLTRTEAAQGGGKRVQVNVGRWVEDLLVTIPPGVESGAKLRLRGKGDGPEGSRGDLYLSVQVQ